MYFNPRPPRGGRPQAIREGRVSVEFQSTSSARRTTVINDEGCSEEYIFQSTSSARRTTPHCRTTAPPPRYFNPRPPRGGRLCTALPRFWKCNFNPRPPRGGRHESVEGGAVLFLFQSTSSARRTTRSCASCTPQPHPFQSTSSARRTTSRRTLGNTRCPNFNPRPPRGGRRFH